MAELRKGIDAVSRTTLSKIQHEAFQNIIDGKRKMSHKYTICMR